MPTLTTDTFVVADSRFPLLQSQRDSQGEQDNKTHIFLHRMDISEGPIYVCESSSYTISVACVRHKNGFLARRAEGSQKIFFPTRNFFPWQDGFFLPGSLNRKCQENFGAELSTETSGSPFRFRT